MLNQLGYNFFRLSRKIQTVWEKKRLRIRFCSYYYLSKKRFKIPSTSVIGKNFSIRADLSESSINIGGYFQARDNFKITMGHSGQLTIGQNCFFNNHCSINCLGKIDIGSNCQFGENVFLYDHNHFYADPSKLISAQGYSVESIKIGNNCWVGSNVVILKGVEIGDRVVIGAGCVIHKSIPAGTLVINQQSQVMSPLKSDEI